MPGARPGMTLEVAFQIASENHGAEPSKRPGPFAGQAGMVVSTSFAQKLVPVGMASSLKS